jgi:hypothetical protein
LQQIRREALKNIPDVDTINAYLESLDLDIRVRPVSNGGKYFWMYDKDGSYNLKVPTSFIHKMENILKNKPELEEELPFLFYQLFVDNVREVHPSFFLHQKLGFLTKDYAEYAIEYDPFEHGKFANAEFFIGEMQVKVSPCSSLFYLIVQGLDSESLYDRHLFTIKLKGITYNNLRNSFESLQNALYSALYYLSIRYPSEDNDLPKIANSLSTIDIDDQVYFNPHHDRNVFFTKVSMPIYPIALRFFYHADLLVLQGVGQEAILYYYRVLEHFFDTAFKEEKNKITSNVTSSFVIKQILRPTLDFLSRIFQTPSKPLKEKDYLRLVLNFDPSHSLWQTVKELKFCECDAKSLANKIYKIRNEIAHGKGKREEKTEVPVLFFTSGDKSPKDIEKIRGNIEVFRTAAKAALIKFGGIEDL